MKEFRVYGGYDTEGMRGHVGVVPPPEPADIQRLNTVSPSSPLVMQEFGTGLEMTFGAESGNEVPPVVWDISGRLAALGHMVVCEEAIRTLRYGEYLLRD